MLAQMKYAAIFYHEAFISDCLDVWFTKYSRSRLNGTTGTAWEKTKNPHYPAVPIIQLPF